MIGPVPSTWEVDASTARAQPVAPGLWRLRLPSAYWHIDHSNAYLVESVAGATLFDCGSGGHRTGHEALERALAETGYAVEDVTDLVLTHHHSDHVGTAAWVKARSGCTVWLHPAHGHFTDAAREPARVHADRRAAAVRGGAPAWLLDAASSVQEELEGLDGPVHADRALGDGTEVPSGLGAWRVVETPGHAPSHVSLHLAEQRVLVSGDLVYAVFAPHYDYGYTPDPVQEFLDSLQRIAALDVDVGLPGHGRPMTGAEVTAAIAFAQAGVRRHLDAARAALQGAARTAYEVMVAVFPDDAESTNAAWRLGDTLAYLDHLALRGVVARTAAAGEPDRYRHT